jgi:hypothetical protein
MSRDERQSRSDTASETGPARRGLGFDSAPSAESMQFGCSMLSQIRLRPKNPRALTPMRCSLGYALHSTEEVRRCMGVEGPADCWKAVQNWRVQPLEVQPAQRNKRSRVAASAAAAEAAAESNGHVAADLLVDQSIAVEVEVEIVEIVQVRSSQGGGTGTDGGEAD